MKICSACKRRRGDFNKNASRSDGLQSKCRECGRRESKKYYRKDPKAHRKRVRDRIAALQLLLLDYLEERKCKDCGEGDPVVLEFDHVRGKKVGHVSQLLLGGASWKTLEREMSKCEVVCANCHRKRTAKRGKYWRVALMKERKKHLGAKL